MIAQVSGRWAPRAAAGCAGRSAPHTKIATSIKATKEKFVRATTMRLQQVLPFNTANDLRELSGQRDYHRMPSVLTDRGHKRGHTM
jgi:hypothetical protein